MQFLDFKKERVYRRAFLERRPENYKLASPVGQVVVRRRRARAEARFGFRLGRRVPAKISRLDILDLSVDDAKLLPQVEALLPDRLEFRFPVRGQPNFFGLEVVETLKLSGITEMDLFIKVFAKL